MSLSAQIQQQFLMAAVNDPSLQKPLTMAIELETFSQILSPVKEFLDHDPVYGNYEVSISRQMEELRKMCLEAYAAHNTNDSEARQGRIELLNTLQNLQESIKDAENAKTVLSETFVIIEKNDRDALSALTDVVQEASEIHGSFLHNYNVAVTLEKSVETLNEAIENAYLPKTQDDLDTFMQNIGMYNDHDLQFKKAATGIESETIQVQQVAEPNTVADNDAEYQQRQLA